LLANHAHLQVLCCVLFLLASAVVWSCLHW